MIKMKIRHSFVSNSSSSSFICTRQDLEQVTVYGDVCSLSLSRFLHDRWKREAWGYFEDPKKSTVKFIPDEDFSKNFGECQYRTLPKSVEDLIDVYEHAYEEAKLDRSDTRRSKWETVHHIEDNIADMLLKVLEPRWKDIDLVEVIASDEPKDDSEQNDEEQMHESFSCMHNPKFYRVYSNH